MRGQGSWVGVHNVICKNNANMIKKYFVKKILRKAHSKIL